MSLDPSGEQVAARPTGELGNQDRVQRHDPDPLALAVDAEHRPGQAVDDVAGVCPGDLAAAQAREPGEQDHQPFPGRGSAQCLGDGVAGRGLWRAR